MTPNSQPRGSKPGALSALLLVGGLATALYASVAVAAGLACEPRHGGLALRIGTAVTGEAAAAQPGLPVIASARSGTAVLGMAPVAIGR